MMDKDRLTSRVPNDFGRLRQNADVWGNVDDPCAAADSQSFEGNAEASQGLAVPRRQEERVDRLFRTGEVISHGHLLKLPALGDNCRGRSVLQSFRRRPLALASVEDERGVNFGGLEIDGLPIGRV